MIILSKVILVMELIYMNQELRDIECFSCIIILSNEDSKLTIKIQKAFNCTDHITKLKILQCYLNCQFDFDDVWFIEYFTENWSNFESNHYSDTRNSNRSISTEILALFCIRWFKKLNSKILKFLLNLEASNKNKIELISTFIKSIQTITVREAHNIFLLLHLHDYQQEQLFLFDKLEDAVLKNNDISFYHDILYEILISIKSNKIIYEKTINTIIKKSRIQLNIFILIIFLAVSHEKSEITKILMKSLSTNINEPKNMAKLKKLCSFFDWKIIFDYDLKLI